MHAFSHIPICFLSMAAGLVLSSTAISQRNIAIAPAIANEQRVALVIGNASYAVSPLRNSANDAADLAAALKGLGFTVLLRTNVTRRQMVESVREFGNRIKRGGVGFFYYAGHGIQSRGKNFLIPVDAQLQSESDLEFESMDANMVLSQMDDAGNRVNIVVLDACRDNPFARSFRSTSRGLAQMDSAKGSFLAYATSPGSVASDGAGRNGTYTKHLLESLKQPETRLEEVFKRVRLGVANETGNRQIPWDSSSVLGDFYFKLPAGETQHATLAPSTPAAPSPIDPAANERAFWESVKDSKNPNELRAYLEQYPHGLFAMLAQERLSSLQPPQIAIAVPSIADTRPPPVSGSIGAQQAIAQTTTGGEVLFVIEERFDIMPSEAIGTLVFNPKPRDDTNLDFTIVRSEIYRSTGFYAPTRLFQYDRDWFGRRGGSMEFVDTKGRKNLFHYESWPPGSYKVRVNVLLGRCRFRNCNDVHNDPDRAKGWRDIKDIDVQVAPGRRVNVFVSLTDAGMNIRQETVDEPFRRDRYAP